VVPSAECDRSRVWGHPWGVDDVFSQNSDGSITDWQGRPDGTFAGNAFHFSVNLGTAWHVQDPFVHDPLV